MNLAEYVSQEMHKDGVTTIDYGVPSTWEEYEVQWVEKYHKQRHVMGTYARMSRALRNSKLFKSGGFIRYNRNNGSEMVTEQFMLADFTGDESEQIYHVDELR